MAILWYYIMVFLWLACCHTFLWIFLWRSCFHRSPYKTFYDFPVFFCVVVSLGMHIWCFGQILVQMYTDWLYWFSFSNNSFVNWVYSRPCNSECDQFNSEMKTLHSHFSIPSKWYHARERIDYFFAQIWEIIIRNNKKAWTKIRFVGNVTINKKILNWYANWNKSTFRLSLTWTNPLSEDLWQHDFQYCTENIHD